MDANHNPGTDVNFQGPYAGQAPYPGQPVPPQGMPPQGTAPQGIPPQGQPQGKPPKKKRPASFWVAIVLAAIVVIVAAVFALQSCDDGSSLFRDPNQSLGQLDGKSAEEIQAELDRQVEEGMFNISIASNVEFENGQAEGELKIENVPGNRYLMQVTITEDATGQVIFTSGVIDPNHHIQRAKLDVDLEPGTYPCTAVFTAYDPADDSEVGQAAAKITVNVLG